MKTRKLGTRDRLQLGHINQFVSALTALEKRLGALEGGQKVAKQPAVRAWALNNTGADLRAGDSAVADHAAAADLDAILADGAVLKLRGFGIVSGGGGSTSTNPDSGKWVTAAAFIRDGEVGPVYVAGIFPARYRDGSGDFVDAPEDGDQVLKRTTTGARLIEACGPTDAGGGELWGLVQMGAANAGGGGGGGGTPGNMKPVVVDETGYAGTSTLYKRDDNVPGNKLVGSPGTVKDNTATLYPSLEYIYKDSPEFELRGQRLRIALTYLDAALCEDLEVVAANDPGAGAKSGTRVKLADKGLRRTASGIDLPAGSGGAILYYDSTSSKWVVLAFSANGKFLGASGGVPAWVDAPVSKWKANP